MKAIEALDNLENFDLWEFSDYKLNKYEAEICKDALRYYIKNVESKEYLFDEAVKESLTDNPDNAERAWRRLLDQGNTIIGVKNDRGKEN